MLSKLEQRMELKKHVNLIHCSNKFSLVQRKLFNALLFNAYPHLDNSNSFTISTQELFKLIGYKSKDYQGLKKSLLGLISTTIEWNIIGEDHLSGTSELWKASSAISSVIMNKGICTYEYSSVMKELFYQPEIYGRINIALLPKFKSCYGLSLYENCIRYQGVPQTPWFELNIFRKLMGIEVGQYENFRDFKKRVLDVAVNEVNQHSSINIVSEIRRQSKKVIAIRFLITKKSTLTIESEDFTYNANDKELVDILSNKFGINQKNILNIIKEYGSAYVREKTNIILASSSFRAGKVISPAAYLTKALRENFQKNRIEMARKEIMVSSEVSIDLMKINYRKYVSKMVEEYIEQISPEEHKNIINTFEGSLKSAADITYTWFKRDGLNHPAVKLLFNNHIVEQHLLGTSGFLNFDEFQTISRKT